MFVYLLNYKKTYLKVKVLLRLLAKIKCEDQESLQLNWAYSQQC